MNEWEDDPGEPPNYGEEMVVRCHRQFSLAWSCGSRQRYTTSSGWKFQHNKQGSKTRAHYFSVTEAPQNNQYPGVEGKENVASPKSKNQEQGTPTSP